MSNENVRKENKMGTMNVPELIVKMSLPMIISMLVQAMYNIVDSIFVARINENALTAVSLTFPIQNLMISVATGTGVGINALLSRHLGEHNYEEANKVARNGIYVEFLSFIAFVLIGFFGTSAFFRTQTDVTEIYEYGKQYMSFISIFSFGIFMEITLERLLQSTGRTFYTMITQGTGAIINIVLDPILIFGLLGMPKLGVLGAAVATVSGQMVAAGLALWFNKKKNVEIDISMKHFRPHQRTIGMIYTIGLPAIIMQAIGSVMTFGMNKILMMFSSTAVAVFGVYFKLQSFVFMPVFGLNNGLIPIIAYNYGAGNKKRIMSAYKFGASIAVSIMIIGLLVFQLVPGELMKMFDASPVMMDMGVKALRIISISFLFAGFCIASSAVFQALGDSIYSLVVSVARQLVVILPVAYIFAVAFGLDMVWWAIPIAEIASVIFTIIFMRKIYKKKIARL